MSFIHETSDVQSTNIGQNTNIWQYCVVLKGAKIGKDCNICSHVFIENDVEVADHVTIKAGVQLWDGIKLESGVFIGPNVTFTNDLFPRSKNHSKPFKKTLVRKNASIGANATLLAGITVGKNAMVGAGALVTKDVPSNAVVVGNPAKVVRFLNND